MSSFKKLKRDCKHERGYLAKDDTCVDCGAVAAPSIRINELHQLLLRSYIAQQEHLVEGSEVQVPANVVLAARIQALEMVLDKQHAAELATSPIVSLQ